MTADVPKTTISETSALGLGFDSVVEDGYESDSAVSFMGDPATQFVAKRWDRPEELE